MTQSQSGCLRREAQIVSYASANHSRSITRLPVGTSRCGLSVSSVPTTPARFASPRTLIAPLALRGSQALRRVSIVAGSERTGQPRGADRLIEAYWPVSAFSASATVIISIIGSSGDGAKPQLA